MTAHTSSKSSDVDKSCLSDKSTPDKNSPSAQDKEEDEDKRHYAVTIWEVITLLPPRNLISLKSGIESLLQGSNAKDDLALPKSPLIKNLQVADQWFAFYPNQEPRVFLTSGL